MKAFTEIELEALRANLDELRARTEAQLGHEDAAHIRHVRTLSRASEALGRVLLHVSFEPVTFALGALGVGVGKILENMEIGHNVLHGQYDFLADPSFDSSTYEWDMVATAKSWKRAHNGTHHSFTNVIGKDDDFGYTAFRFSEDVKWKPSHLLQPLASPLSGVFFDHSIALFDVRLTHLLPKTFRNEELGPRQEAELRDNLVGFVKKTARLYAKDYLFYPALAGPFAPKVALGNALANTLRNVWAYAVIYCGHLTEQTATFDESCLEKESRGHFYLRQITGSSNFEAGPFLGVLSGHLSHQIEHHLFPRIPAWRYRAMAPEVRDICEKHGVPYNTGTFRQQLASVFRRLVAHALPDGGRRAAAPVNEASSPRPVEAATAGRRGRGLRAAPTAAIAAP